MSTSGQASHLTKDTIIHQHELLWKSVSNQQISLRDKEALLDRLEQISKDIVAKRKFTIHDLQQWNNQIEKIKDEAAIASSKSTK